MTAMIREMIDMVRERLHELSPGWKYVSCYCTAGTNMDGYECDSCAGWGFYWKHIKSGVLAQYPGGPFLGREPNEL